MSQRSSFGEEKPNPLQILRILWGESKYSRLGTKGFKLQEQGRVREAIATFHQAIATLRKLHKNFPDAYAHPMGQFYMNIGNGHFELGEMRVASEAYQTSVSHFRRADLLHPGLCVDELARALLNSSVALVRMSEFDSARAALEEARDRFLELDAGQPGAFAGDIALAEFHLANLLCEIGEAGQGKEAVERSLVRFQDLERQRPGQHTEDLADAYNSLGAISGQLGHYREAEQALQTALELHERVRRRPGDVRRMNRAATWLNLASNQAKAGKLHEAKRTFEMAIELLEQANLASEGGLSLLLAQARGNYANLLKDLGLLQEARDVLEPSLSLLTRLKANQPDAFAKELASVQMNLGATYAELGEYEKAERSLNEALSCLGGLEDRSPGRPEIATFRHMRAKILMNLGIVLSWKRRFDDARTLLGQALEIFQELSADQQTLYRTEIAAIHTNLGNLEWRAGDLLAARDIYREALTQIEALEAARPGQFQRELAVVEGNLGMIYGDLEDQGRGTEFSLASLERWRELERAEPGAYTASLAGTLANVAVNDLEMRRFEQAVEVLQEVVGLYQELETRQPGVYVGGLAKNYSRLFRGLQHVSRSRDDIEASELKNALEEVATQVHRQAIATFERLESKQPGVHTRELAIWKTNLGTTYLEQGKIDAAVAELEGAEELLRRLRDMGSASDSDRATVLEALGRVRRRQGRSGEAYEHWRDALELSEKRRSTLPNGRSREQAQWEFFPLYRRMTELCLEMGRVVEAWQVAERGKARGMADLFAGMSSARALLTEQRELLDRWLEAEQVVLRLQPSEPPGERMLPYPDRIGIPKLSKDFNAEARAWAIAREQRLRHEVQEQLENELLHADVPPPEEMAKALARMVYARPVLLVQLVPLVDDERTHVEPRRERYALFLLRLDSGLNDRCDLETALKSAIIEFEPGTATLIGAAFYRLVRPEVRPANASDPFESAYAHLSDMLGRQCVQPIFEKIEALLGAPLSAFDLDALLFVPGGIFNIVPLHAARLAEKRYLIDEFPVFYLASSHLAGRLVAARDQGPETSSCLLMGPPSEASEGVYLSEARQEVEDIGRLLDESGFAVQVHTRQAMTLNALREHGLHRLLHLATHSSFYGQVYLKSWIQFDNEKLSLDRLVQDPAFDFSGTRLVYLSSCDAGWVEGLWSDEVQSLSLGLLAAGAGAVLSSLMPVLDASAPALARFFYEELANEKSSFAVAYQVAVQRLRQDQDGRFDNPRYWAPMMLHGRGLDRLL